VQSMELLHSTARLQSLTQSGVSALAWIAACPNDQGLKFLHTPSHVLTVLTGY
jgi:hypothetical protein